VASLVSDSSPGNKRERGEEPEPGHSLAPKNRIARNRVWIQATDPAGAPTGRIISFPNTGGANVSARTLSPPERGGHRPRAMGFLSGRQRGSEITMPFYSAFEIETIERRAGRGERLKRTKLLPGVERFGPETARHSSGKKAKHGTQFEGRGNWSTTSDAE